MLLWPRRRAARWGLASALSVSTLVLVALATLCVTSGCSSIGYLGQSASGHVHLLAAARPVKDVIADPSTSESLRARLRLTQRMRDFAVTELKEPDNGSYR
jgi:predicted aminopeptidase